MTLNPTLLVQPVLAAGQQVGRIKGGWSFVWAAYLVTWISLSLYAASLWARRKALSDSERGNP